MSDQGPSLYTFRQKRRDWARWLICSWKGHKFSQPIVMGNGTVLIAPLPCCERCGVMNPHIIFPGVNSQGLQNRPHELEGDKK